MDDFATGYLAGQDGGNNNGGFFGNEGLWAVIILAIIFGWGNYGNGRNGSDNGMASYIPYLVGTGASGQGGADTRAARERSGTQRVQRRQRHQPCHHAGRQRTAGWSDRTCNATGILLLREQAVDRRPEVHHRNGGLRYPSGYRRQRPRHRGKLQRQLPQHDGLLHAG